MQTISSTEATAPVIAFEHGHRTFLWKGEVVTVTAVGLVTGVGWTFAFKHSAEAKWTAPAHEFEAVTPDWIVQVPGLPSGFRKVEWVSSPDHAEEDGGYWEFSGPAFEAPVVT